MGVFLFLGYLYSFWSILFHIAFDKMQIPYMKKYSNIPNLYIVCLATTWSLRFCAVTSVAALFIC